MADLSPSPAPPNRTGALPSIVAFILELDKLKGVTRKTRPLGLERYENSAEHSWQIALLAAFALLLQAPEALRSPALALGANRACAFALCARAETVRR